MMNKYGNIKVVTSDGIRHDSRREAARWSELKVLEKCGAIRDLKRQVKFEVIPKQDGEKACKYIADFVYIDVATGKTVVEDCKGMRTEVYKIKRKLMLYVHGIRIRET